MFLFFTGAIDVAYVGITPFVLGHSYGLPVRIVGIAQEYGPSHAVVLREPARAAKQPGLRIGTVLGSDAHRVAAAWADTVEQTVSYVNLPPVDQLRALEHGFIDGLAVWEPHIAAAQQAGAAVVFETDQSGVAGFNLVCATEAAIRSKPQWLQAFLAAHTKAVEIIARGDLEQHAGVLHAVFEGKVAPDDYARLLRDGYRWPTGELWRAEEVPESLLESLAATNRFLTEIGLAPEREFDPKSCFPEGWSIAPGDDARLAVGYSDSLMCAAFYLAQGIGLFEEQGFIVDSDERRLIERIAYLDSEFKQDLQAADRLLTADPELAVMKLGRINEDVFTRIYTATMRTAAPKQLSKALATLEEEEIVPAAILSSAHWIRSVRNIAAHRGEVSRSHARSCYSHMVDILEWFSRERAALSVVATRCFRCRKPLQPEWKACPHCGAVQRADCASCGHALQADWKACPNCGTPTG